MSRAAPPRPDNARRAALLLLAALFVLVTTIAVLLVANNQVLVSVSATPSPPVVPSPTVGPATAPAPASTLMPTASAAPTPRASPRPGRSPRPTASPTPALPTDATLDAALARCPTAAEVAFVDARLELVFLNDPTAPELVCRAADGSADLTRQQERTYQAVLTMRRIPFDRPLEWTRRPLFRWFTNAIDGIIVDGDAPVSYCCEFGSIVLRGAPEMGWLHGNGWNEADGGGLISLVTLMIHEARHNEGYLHDCNTLEPSGPLADDQTVEQLGSWGVQYYFAQALSEVTDPYMTPPDQPADAYRMSALESMESIRRYRICEPLP